MAEIIWRGDAVSASVLKLVEKKLLKAAIHVEGEIKKIITEKGIVDTGLLRSSISYTMNDGSNSNTVGGPVSTPNTPYSAHIGTRIFYAPFHEFGTRFISPRPFIRPGFERSKKKIKEIFNTKEKL